MPRPKNTPPRPASAAEQLWSTVLSELEAELEAPGVDPADGSYAGSGMWQSPARLPVLPESLRERASALHARQRDRSEELQAERAQIHRHLEALRVVPRPRSAAASVYLDVTG